MLIYNCVKIFLNLKIYTFNLTILNNYRLKNITKNCSLYINNIQNKSIYLKFKIYKTKLLK